MPVHLSLCCNCKSRYCPKYSLYDFFTQLCSPVIIHWVNLNQNELPNEAQPLIRQCGRANSLKYIYKWQLINRGKLRLQRTFLETPISFYCLWTKSWHLSTGRLDLSHKRHGWHWVHICSYFTELVWPEPVVLVFPHCREKARLACLLFDVRTHYKVTCYMLIRFTLVA